MRDRVHDRRGRRATRRSASSSRRPRSATPPATLTLTTNDPDPGDAAIAISLDGNGAASQIAGAPTTLAFGNVDVGKSLPLVLTVSNTGNSNLDISGATLSGAAAFSVTDGSLGAQTLRAGHRDDVDDQVHADRDRARRQGRDVHDHRVTRSRIERRSVTLSCTGQLGQFSRSPTPFDFGGVREGDTKQQTFTLTNAGNAQVTGITATLADHDARLLDQSRCRPTSLAGGGSTTMVVQFNADERARAAARTQVAIAGAWGTQPADAGRGDAVDSPVGQGRAGYDVSTTALAVWRHRCGTRHVTPDVHDPARGLRDRWRSERLDLAPTATTASNEITHVDRCRRTA